MSTSEQVLWISLYGSKQKCPNELCSADHTLSEHPLRGAYSASVANSKMPESHGPASGLHRQCSHRSEVLAKTILLIHTECCSNRIVWTFYKNWPKCGQKVVEMDTQKPSGCLRNCD
ncbi:uncharacterized protein LOC119160798 isoform X1 [Rhipicephalus microplus]|uniref:uncharacterized protein LOC119160798 isoform X1 n=1 Tax=Rhipicephalus microplus TaxID=6941 RepID=UPI003F6D1AC2